MKGERLMALGSYYEGRGEYRAAALQYQQVASDFGSTPLAEDATNRLAQISDKPSKSNEPPAWVAKIFPESKPVEPIFGTGINPENSIRCGTGSILITTCLAVKTNHVEIPRKIRTPPIRKPTTHLTPISGFSFPAGGLERKGIGSIFIGAFFSGPS